MYAVWTTENIRVYSTETNETFIVEWQNVFSSLHRIFGHGLYWLDNEHLLYSQGDYLDEKWFVVNPFTGEIDDWQGAFTPSNFEDIISPDALKILSHDDWTDPYWTLNNSDAEIEVPIIGGGEWHPDSSRFVAHTQRAERYEPDEIVVFDLDGNITDKIFDIPEGVQLPFQLTNNWSPDGRYLLFATDQLYLADLQEKRVIDLCIPTGISITAAWSPSNSQFAFIDWQQNGLEVHVLDMETWERYIVAYHRGDMIGWSADS